jgi:hypothetical protein
MKMVANGVSENNQSAAIANEENRSGANGSVNDHQRRK